MRMFEDDSLREGKHSTAIQEKVPRGVPDREEILSGPNFGSFRLRESLGTFSTLNAGGTPALWIDRTAFFVKSLHCRLGLARRAQARMWGPIESHIFLFVLLSRPFGFHTISAGQGEGDEHMATCGLNNAKCADSDGKRNVLRLFSA